MTTVGVVGMGYVGLTLAVALAQRGVTVHGTDRAPHVLDALAAGTPHLFEPGVPEALRESLGTTLFVAPALPAVSFDAIVICVSTPVDLDTGRPDLSGLRAAAEAVAAGGHRDALVVVRSTVPVGTTRSIVLSTLTARWGSAHVAFAPERTIQGQALRELATLPQVIGGVDDASAAKATALFERLTKRVVRVSSLEAAEMVKLVNNCHTDLIYSYGNEVALLAERLRLDPLEVIRAANLDYPRPDLARPGFVGGGCLTKDPYILLESARTVGHQPWLVGQARALNEHLPGHVARRFLDLLRETRGDVAGARVLLLGFAYKGWPPTDDMRGAPVVPMMEVLRPAGVEVRGHDFLVGPSVIEGLGGLPCALEEGFDDADGVLVINEHPDYRKADVGALVRRLRRPALVYDCWRIFDEETIRAAGARYAAIGYA